MTGPPAERSAIRLALLAADPWLAGLVAGLPREAPPTTVVLELALSYAQVGEEQLAQLRQRRPDVVLLDFSREFRSALELAQHLSGAMPQVRLLGAGSVPGTSELLEVMRAGVSEYVAQPATPDQLGQALQRLALRLDRNGEAPVEPGRITAVFGTKGGAGSTTVATNLAIALHQLTGQRTLLLDLDLELGELALFLGLKPAYTFVDLIENFHRLDSQLLESFVIRHPSGVHLLASPFHPEQVPDVGADQVRRMLQFLRDHYGHVIVDTSKSFAAPTLAVFDTCDTTLLVTVLDLPSLRNTQRTLPLLRQRLPRGDSQVQLVVNRYEATSVISLGEVARTVGLKVQRTLANDYAAVMKSINTARPVLLENAASPFARDVRELATELAGPRPGTNGARPSGARAILSRISGIMRRPQE